MISRSRDTRTGISLCGVPRGAPPLICTMPLTCPDGSDDEFDFTETQPGVHILGGNAFEFLPLCGGLQVSIDHPTAPDVNGVTVAVCPGNPAQVCISYDGSLNTAGGVWVGNIIVGNGVDPPCTIPYTIIVTT